MMEVAEKVAQEDAGMEINKLKAQIGDILMEVKRHKALTAMESTKRLNTEKRLSKWEGSLKKCGRGKEKAFEEYQAL